MAPIALYPDPLLGQVLAASTYPLELVEANQFVQQNRNLQGQDLMNAARQQNWDPSVQALVAFPNVLMLLTSDVRWITDLGNAFLAQQQDVMAAVHRQSAEPPSLKFPWLRFGTGLAASGVMAAAGTALLARFGPSFVAIPEPLAPLATVAPELGYAAASVILSLALAALPRLLIGLRS